MYASEAGIPAIREVNSVQDEVAAALLENTIRLRPAESPILF
jgi:hypothetical protein